MQEIVIAIEKVIKDLFGVDEQVELTRTDEQFGDYATNVALRLHSSLKLRTAGSKKLENPPAGGPREIAHKIVEHIKSDLIEKTEVAGPGFINITLTEAALFSLVPSTQIESRFSGKKVVIETNNPNPFKAMHIGHAFNAILADTIANLLELGGAKTHRVSYHGDVGAHVGRSMYSLLKFVEGDSSKLDQVKPEERNSFMSRMYAEGSKAYKEDESAKKEIDKLSSQSFVLDDPTYKKVYETCKAWSFEQIEQLVATLGNKPVEKRYVESEADSLGVKTVKQHVPDVFIESDGALVFPGEQYGIFDNVFVSSAGQGLYGARDLGLMQLKNQDFKAQKSYIVTAEEQKDYFRGVIKAAELCLPELRDVTVNISTGTVKLTTGKMSSRTGEVVEVAWLFEKVAEAIKERGGQPTDAVIAGSLRYQFLKVKIGSDVIFDVNEAVSITGNSGPYLQYAYARANSILQKATIQGEFLIQGVALQAGERSLIRKISEYQEVLERSVSELMPHYICTYLYELAQTFNRFYEKNRVIGDERESLRLELIARYATTLKHGLELLGIQAPEKM